MGSSRSRTTRPLTAALVLAVAAPTVVLGIAGGALPASAAPPTIAVDTWEDELNADGDCSLREAIETLNTGVDVDGCQVPIAPEIDISGVTVFLSAPLIVTESMTIRGLDDLPSSIECSSVAGNCIENAGAGSNLDLVNLWVSMADGLQVYAEPGAGHLQLTDVNVWGGAGGVVSSGGEIVLSHSTVWDTSDWGVFSLNGDITIDHSVLGGHNSGAVYADLADVSVSSSAFYWNEGDVIFGQSGDVEIVNTTIADNGGVAARTHDGTVTYRSATVVDNAAAMELTGPGEIRFSNTVVADSGVANCADPATSLGFNVSDDASCTFGAETDRTGIDPGLAAFDNTAPSPSAPLLEDSELIDSGGDCLTLDQYDAPRPTDGDGDGAATCDVGAVESPAAAPADPTDPDDPSDPDAPLAPAPAATAVSTTPRFTG